MSGAWPVKKWTSIVSHLVREDFEARISTRTAAMHSARAAMVIENTKKVAAIRAELL